MSKITKTSRLNVFLVVIFSLFFVAISLVAAKNINFLTDKLDTAFFQGVVAIGTTTVTAVLNIDATSLEQQLAIDTGSGGISMNYAAINESDLINKAYLSSLVVPAGLVQAGSFGSSTGGGNYTFPEDLTISGLSGIGNKIVYVDSSGLLVASSTVPAANIKAGTFGSSVGNGDFDFPGDIGVGAVDDERVYKWNNTKGYNPHVGYSGGGVTTMVVGGGIILDMTWTNALTQTVDVRNATNTGSCRLTFSSGLLVAETCP